MMQGRRSGGWMVVALLSAVLCSCARQAGPTVALTAMPSPAATAIATPAATLTPAGPGLSLTIVYDNCPYDERLQTDWGYACWVETGASTLLFDTGADGAVLLANLQVLGLDPQAIDAVVLSHAHADHAGGLAALLDTGARPAVYMPASFPSAFKREVADRTRVVEVSEAAELLPGVWSTGEAGREIVEQALVVETGEGLVVLTGCAHPGIVEMVRRAVEAVPGEVALVAGGFHLEGQPAGQVEAVCGELRELGVRRVAPSHCTGEEARGVFADRFGAGFLPVGVGWQATIGDDEGAARHPVRTAVFALAVGRR